MTMKKAATAALAAAVATGAAAACSSAHGSPDKSGGEAPMTLTLINSDNSDLNGVPAVQRFIDRVRQLSGGTVTIKVRALDWAQANVEQHVVADVQADKAQLAWVGTRVWDTIGVNSFRALHAPMLVDSYAAEAAVLRSDLAAKMLAGVAGHGIVGLALLGDNLRYPAAAKRTLRAPADFRGLRFGSYTSATQAADLRALGAKPVFAPASEREPFLQSGLLDAIEIDLKTYEDNAYAGVAPYVSLNLALWPRTTVLFANADALAMLSDQQEHWIRQASSDAAKYSLTTLGEDQRIVPLECRNA